MQYFPGILSAVICQVFSVLSEQGYYKLLAKRFYLFFHRLWFTQKSIKKINVRYLAFSSVLMHNKTQFAFLYNTCVLWLTGFLRGRTWMENRSKILKSNLFVLQHIYRTIFPYLIVVYSSPFQGTYRHYSTINIYSIHLFKKCVKIETAGHKKFGRGRRSSCLAVHMRKHYCLNEENRWTTLQFFTFKVYTFFP